MAAPQSTPLPEAPTRGEAEGQFVPKANAFVGALEPFRQQLQRQADYVNTRTSQLEQAATRAENAESGALDAEATSAANANFAGNWSSLSGSYSVPTSVFHEGYFWALVQNVSSIGDHEPGESSAWVIIQRASRELSVEPTLSSNFRTGEHKLYGVQDGYKSRDLADIWDVTRASGETVLTPAGRIATVDPDTLPLTYVPETGGLGAQVYGAVTNQLLWSDDWSVSPWEEQDATIQSSSVEAPDPSETAQKMVENTNNSSHSMRQTFPQTEGDLRGWVVFAKPAENHILHVWGSGSWVFEDVSCRVNLETLEFLSGENRCKALRLSGGWVLVWLDALVTASSTSNAEIRIGMARDPSFLTAGAYQGDGSSGLYVWRAGVVSYTRAIPPKTEASTVTKPATNVVRELGEEFNRGEFTLLVDVTPLAVTGAFFGVADSFSDTVYASSSSISIRSGGNLLFIRSYHPEAGRRDRLAVRVKSGDHAIVINSSIQTSEATGVPESLVRMRVGGAPWSVSPAGDVSLVAHHIECIPRALSDAEIIEWTRG